MLAAQGAPPLPKLSDMKGDADASVMGFFNSYAAELPDELAAKCRQVGTEFLARFGKTRLGPLFMLPAQKARDVLACNLDDGWLESIEEQAGFRFKEHSVPPSAELVCAMGETAPAKQAKRERKRPDTISEELGDMLPQETIPKWIFDKCITTHEPLVKTLTEPELSGMTSEILSYFASRFGHFKLGSPLCRHLGNKLTRALPHLPAYGSTLGIDRRWGKMLADKAKNRQYVRAAHEPAPSCPSLTQSVPCLSQKDFNTPIEIRSADMTEAVKLKLESSRLCSGGRVTIDISKSESSAESFAVKDEVLPQQPDVPPACSCRSGTAGDQFGDDGHQHLHNAVARLDQAAPPPWRPSRRSRSRVDRGRRGGSRSRGKEGRRLGKGEGEARRDQAEKAGGRRRRRRAAAAASSSPRFPPPPPRRRHRQTQGCRRDNGHNGQEEIGACSTSAPPPSSSHPLTPGICLTHPPLAHPPLGAGTTKPREGERGARSNQAQGEAKG